MPIRLLTGAASSGTAAAAAPAAAAAAGCTRPKVDTSYTIKLHVLHLAHQSYTGCLKSTLLRSLASGLNSFTLLLCPCCCMHRRQYSPASFPSVFITITTAVHTFIVLKTSGECESLKFKHGTVGRDIHDQGQKSLHHPNIHLFVAVTVSAQ
jgi:hypothetical protein